MASAILFASVLAVISAIMAGQEEAIEAQRRMQAALVADDLMGQIATMDSAALDGLGSSQPAGPFLANISTVTLYEDLPNLDIRVHGTHVHVQIVPSMAELGVILAEADLFIPDPQP